MKKILITGGKGYIGINLIEILNTIPEYEVVVVDPGPGKGLSLNRAEDLTGLSHVDGVVHLAAVSGIVNCETNIQSAITSNVSASYNIFNLAQLYGVPCIFTSSQAAKTPLANFYAMTKHIAEVEAMRQNKRGANIKIFRLTNVYGGTGYLQQKDTVVSKFAKALRNREKMIVNGEGTQMRDFIHVDDVCKAIILGLQSKSFIKEPLDIGTGEPTSVLQLAKMFGDSFTFDPESDKVGTSRNVADTKKALETLGFKAKWKVKDYVESLKKV